VRAGPSAGPSAGKGKTAAVVTPSTIRRRWSEAERALAAASKQRDLLAAELGNALDHRELAALGERVAVAQAAVDTAEEAWLSLAAEAERLGLEL